MEHIESFSSLETNVLSLINQNINSFDELSENVSFGEQLLTKTLEGLLSKNILVFDNKNKTYGYDKPLTNDVVILEGNILLPTTIIRVKEKGIMYITRGNWYQFPIDFDIRSIIWNVKLIGKNTSTLIDLISTSVLKQRKSKIKHNPEYDQLKKKIVPYNDKLGLLINSVGDDVTDVSIIFKIHLNKNDVMAPIHKKFMVGSEILTKELIDELSKPTSERNWSNIKLNLIYNFSDFIFKDNEIPTHIDNDNLTYVKIASVKKGYELVYYTMGQSGLSKKVDSEFYEDTNEAFSKLRELFSGLPTQLLIDNDFMCELEN